MEQHELLGYLVRCLEKCGVPYFITGAVACIAYGEPRFTNDIDMEGYSGKAFKIAAKHKGISFEVIPR